MSEDPREAPHVDNPYPVRGYLFNFDGTHGPGVSLGCKADLFGWLELNVPFAVATGVQLIVEDKDGMCVFQVKDHAILWPNDTGIPPNS